MNQRAEEELLFTMRYHGLHPREIKDRDDRKRLPRLIQKGLIEGPDEMGKYNLTRAGRDVVQPRIRRIITELDEKRQRDAGFG